jgi:hypothetical protein
VQWELPGPVARRDQRHSPLSFPIPVFRMALWPDGSPSCGAAAAGARSKSSLKGGHEDQRRAPEWPDVSAPSGRAKAKRWSPSARTGCNSHCTPTDRRKSLESHRRGAGILGGISRYKSREILEGWGDHPTRRLRTPISPASGERSVETNDRNAPI